MTERTATPLRTDRYNRILDAAYEIADEGGYDALQMRAVSERSGVSLATIYRYFRSRDLLAYVVSQQWATRVVAEARGRDRRGTDPVALLVRQIRASARALYAQRNMLETWARATLTNDPEVAARIRDRIATESLAAMPLPEGVDEAAWREVLVYIDAIFYAGAVRWSHGQKNYEDIPREVERAVRLILAAQPASPPKGTSRRRRSE